MQNADNLYEDFQRLVNICPSHLPGGQVSAPSNDQVVEGFKSALHALTIRPGEMESVMRPMVDLMLQCNDESIVHSIIELLFEQVRPNIKIVLFPASRPFRP